MITFPPKNRHSTSGFKANTLETIIGSLIMLFVFNLLFSSCLRDSRFHEVEHWECKDNSCTVQIMCRSITRSVLANNSVLVFMESSPYSGLWQPLPYMEVFDTHFDLYNYTYERHWVVITKTSSDGFLPNNPGLIRIRIAITTTESDNDDDLKTPVNYEDIEHLVIEAQDFEIE